MTTTTRFLTGSLASLAIASAVTMAGPSAYAADAPDRPCGQPAVPAVFTTLVREPQVRPVAAVTHDEWRWEHTVTTVLHEYSTVVTASFTRTTWTRELPVLTEYQWSRRVVTQQAQAAVAATPELGFWEDVPAGDAPSGRVEYEYVQKQHPEMTRWEAAGWNGEQGDVDHGQGWTRTGNARQWVVTQEARSGTDAVPEVSELELQWSATSPGAGWTRTAEAPRTQGGGTETTTTDGDDAPGAGWTKTATETVPAVVHTVFAAEAPAGYTETASAPQVEVSTETTAGTSADAPGEDWSKVAGSQVTVVDRGATTELVGGSIEQVLVRPALPASEPCAPAVDVPTLSTTAGPAAGASTVAVAGPRGHAAAGVASAPSAAGPAGSAAVVLPNTGGPISPLLLTTGLGSLLAGGALICISRRRQAD